LIFEGHGASRSSDKALGGLEDHLSLALFETLANDRSRDSIPLS
jgi:hypothetical protein